MQYMRSKNLLAYAALAAALLVACNGKEKPAPKPEEKPAETYKKVSPDFNADSAYYFVQKQVNFGPRVNNTPAHVQCGDWIVNEFKKYCDRVTEQKAVVPNYEGKKLNIRNIIASVNPSASQRVLICAHWDSRPYADNDPNPANHDKPILAADDGASGVAVMLEMARAMKAAKPNIGIDFICFDAEDWGKSNQGEESYCLGSQYWGKHPHSPGYKADFGILLDMVGGINAHFTWEGNSMQFAENRVRQVWGTAGQLGYSNYFYNVANGSVTDDHYYVNKLTGIPTIDVINFSQGFAPHWHTLNDNMSIIDRNTLRAVGQTLLEVAYTEKTK